MLQNSGPGRESPESGLATTRVDVVDTFRPVDDQTADSVDHVDANDRTSLIRDQNVGVIDPIDP